MVLCSGCGRTFQQTGYQRHIKSSQKHGCHAIYRELHSYIPGMDNSPEDEHEGEPTLVMGSGGSNTAADYFGVYQEDDYMWTNEQNITDEPPNYEQDSAGNDLGDMDWEDDVNLKEDSESDDEEDNDESSNDREDEDANPPPAAQSHAAESDTTRHRRQQPNYASVTIFGGRAGEPIPLQHEEFTTTSFGDYHVNLSSSESASTWAPFLSQIDWEFARWAKLRGPGSTAVSDLLKIEGVSPYFLLYAPCKVTNVHQFCDKLGLSYKNSRELNKIIDRGLPLRPRFERHEITVAGSKFDVYYRDILACIKALYGDPEFAEHLKFIPERHYADTDKTVRVYHDMYTGNWWWQTQVFTTVIYSFVSCLT